MNAVTPLNLVVGLVDELRRRNPDLDETLISDMILGVVSPVGDQAGWPSFSPQLVSRRGPPPKVDSSHRLDWALLSAIE